MSFPSLKKYTKARGTILKAKIIISKKCKGKLLKPPSSDIKKLKTNKSYIINVLFTN